MKFTTLKTAFFLPALIGGGALAFAAPGGGANAGVATGPTHPAQTMPAALRPALYNALARDAAGAREVGANGCATLANSALEACFGRGGARFGAAAAPRLALRLGAYGRGDRLVSVAPVRPEIAGNRVNYRHGALTEWWRVLPMGFEQGFTLAKRPAGHGELTLALVANKRASERRDELGWGALRYGKLVVTDARGKVVPARLEHRGKRVLIAVNDAHAVYPLTVDPLVWLEQKASANDGVAGDQLGYSVALSGTTAIVGAAYATVNGNSAQGAAYIFSESGGTWTQTAKLTAGDGAAGDNFGWSVAISGNTAVVGAPIATINGNTYEGAAYVFTESNGSWSQQQKLTASDGAANYQFGWSVAVSGSTALVGADGATVNGNFVQGAAYVFGESGGTWSQTAELTASDGVAGDSFGSAVALDGTTALVGAYFAVVNGNFDQGSAYVFDESGGSWSQTAKLTASDGASGDYFGGSVALDGTTALVGAEDASVNGLVAAGAAYVFSDAGGTWTQTARLTASDYGQFYYFGSSVALSGTTALVGAKSTPVNGNANQGEAYFFSDAGGTWSQTAKLTASDGGPYYFFGFSVALDGTTGLVGAKSAAVNGNFNQGAAYFEGPGDLDLAVSAPDAVGQGETYTSQTIATNSSSAASPAVAVTVAVPAAASFVSAAASQGSCSEASGVVSCAFGQIAGGGGTATANVTLKAAGASGTVIENTASVAKANPALTASAPTQISACGAGYTEYDGTLAAGGHAIEPSGTPYQAPAGMENGVLTAPAGFSLYVVYQSGGVRHVFRAPGNELHHYGPAGRYAWVVKAGDTGGNFSFCLKHP